MRQWESRRARLQEAGREPGIARTAIEASEVPRTVMELPEKAVSRKGGLDQVNSWYFLLVECAANALRILVSYSEFLRITVDY